MNEADEALYQAIREAERTRSITRKKKSLQVQGLERDNIRATSLTWFNTHRKKLAAVIPETELQPVDGMYQKIMDASHKDSLRSKYVKTFKEITEKLVRLRSVNVVRLAACPRQSRTKQGTYFHCYCRSKRQAGENPNAEGLDTAGLHWGSPRAEVDYRGSKRRRSCSARLQKLHPPSKGIIARHFPYPR